MLKFKDFLSESKKLLPYNATLRGDVVGHYDPEYMEMHHEPIEDDDGKVLAVRHRLKSKENARLKPPIEHSPDLMYRGMSHDEYHNFLKTGEIKSNGSYNIGDEQKGLTYFTTDPRTAESYSSSFAPSQHKPNWNKNAYIVAAKKVGPENLVNVKGTGEHELGVNRAISKDEVTHVYRGKVIAHDPGINTKGFQSAPSSWLHWEKI